MNKLSNTAIVVLRWCDSHKPGERRYPSALAETLWPGKRGHGGVGYAKCAGSLLGKYRKAGIISAHDSVTDLGREMLAAAQHAPAADASPVAGENNSSEHTGSRG